MTHLLGRGLHGVVFRPPLLLLLLFPLQSTWTNNNTKSVENNNPTAQPICPHFTTKLFSITLTSTSLLHYLVFIGFAAAFLLGVGRSLRC